MAKQHKYNVGDEITVKIAAVKENDGKASYRIKGIENIKFSEGGIDAAAIKKPKPGDPVYFVMVDHMEQKVFLETIEIEDIATKELKVKDTWFDIESEDTFFNEKNAEDYAEYYAKLHGYPIVKEDLFTKGDANGN